MKINLLLLSVFLFSCGSSPSRKNDDKPKVELNFKKPVSSTYNQNSDLFNQSQNPMNSSLADESVFRLESSDLNNLNKSQDVINQIISLCYLKKVDEGLMLAKNSYHYFENNPSYWNQVGTCYLLKGEKRKALLYYNKSLDVNSNYTPALNNLGVYYTSIKEYPKALLAFQKAQKTSSFSKTPRFNLAQLYLSFGLAQDSLVLFQGLSKQSAGDIDVLIGLAQSYLSLNMASEAYNIFKNIPDSHRSRPEVSISFAYSAWLVGQKDEASTILKLASNSTKEYRPYFEKIKKIIEGR